MKYSIYSIRDAHTGFLSPTFEQNDAVAMRNFSHAVVHGNTVMNSHSADYNLYHVGYFDTDSGLVTPVTPPKLVMSATSCFSV